MNPRRAQKLLQQLDYHLTAVAVRLLAAGGALQPGCTWLSGLPSLSTLDLSSNELSGSVSACSDWPVAPLVSLNLANNQLNGTLPPITSATLNHLVLANNRFTSTLPKLVAPVLLQLHLSGNQLVGPLSLDGSWLPLLLEMHVGDNQLGCPVNVSGAAPALITLDISLNRFDAQCGLQHVFDANAFTLLTWFDGSNNAFAGGLPAAASPALQSFICANCGLHLLGMPRQWSINLLLSTLVLRNNSIDAVRWDFPYGLRTLDVSSCGLRGQLFSGLPRFLNSRPVVLALTELNIADNELSGALDIHLLSQTGAGFNPLAHLQRFNAARNRFSGLLPSISQDSQLTFLDLSGNRFYGSIPSEYGQLRLMMEMRLEGNLLQSQTAVLPSFIQPSASGLRIPADFNNTYSCSSLSFAGRPQSVLTIEPAYFSFAHCSCNDDYFGLGNNCRPCRAPCVCRQQVVQNCYPIVRYPGLPAPALLGGASGGLTSRSHARPRKRRRGSPTAGVSSPPLDLSFTVELMLPCPLDGAGRNRCNPAATNWTFSSAAATTVAPIPPFCAAGYAGRLCTACADSYFQRGRDCIRCWQHATLFLVICGCIAKVALLLLLLYCKNPTAADFQPQPAAHAAELINRNHLSPAANNAVNSSASSPLLMGHEFELPRELSATAVYSTAADPASYSAAVGGPSAAERLVGAELARNLQPTSNLLMLLLFHSQQMGLLLFTQSFLPLPLRWLLHITNSGADGFTFSSLLAWECVVEWRLEHQLALSLGVSLTAMAATAGLLMWLLRGADGRQRAETAASPRIVRLLGMSVSVLYLMALPALQLSLSAVAMTDLRETSLPHLNLMPFVALTARWWTSILPLALVNLFLWLLLFPALSTWLLLRAHFQSTHPLCTADVLWPLFGSQMSSNKSSHWYWGQVLLLRRYLFVMVVAITPAYSTYLPFMLVLLVLAAATLQHICRPYADTRLWMAEPVAAAKADYEAEAEAEDETETGLLGRCRRRLRSPGAWSHLGDLCSLYLLLINYFAALVLQSDVMSGGGGDTHAEAARDLWAALLVTVNATFLLLLAAGVLAEVSPKIRRTASGWTNCCSRCIPPIARSAAILPIRS